MCNKFLISAFSFLTLLCGARAQTVIKLNPESEGRYTLDATVNGVGVRTYYTEESWFASMSSTTYLFLYENGYIADADVKGMTVLKMPDGSTTKAGSFIIRSLRIGNVIVKDLPAFVIKKQTVPLVVGNSSFDCFGDVEIKDDELWIYDGIERKESIQPSAPVRTPSVQDSLMEAAQMHLDAKEYPEAAACFEALMEKEELNMYNSYQYIMLLNILKRDNEVITRSDIWLDAYEGKTTYLDFWIYDAIGDAYSRIENHQKSISAYERAVAEYFSMFNTTEKKMMKSAKSDTTLGVTMFNLAKQYAANGNLMKSQHCYFVSAKCGNEDAIEVCRKYKIKR